MSSWSLEWSVGERVSGLRDPPCRAQQRPSRVLTLTEASGRGSSRRGCRGGTHLSFSRCTENLSISELLSPFILEKNPYNFFILYFYLITITALFSYFFLMYNYNETRDGQVFHAVHHRITPLPPPRSTRPHQSTPASQITSPYTLSIFRSSTREYHKRFTRLAFIANTNNLRLVTLELLESLASLNLIKKKN